jgi:zinc protease
MSTILLERDPALPLIQLSVVLRHGAQVDPPGKEGLTRLAIRLMRRTAHGLAAEAVDEQLDSLGSSLMSDVSVSSCGFAGSVISRSLDPYVDLLNGVLAHASLDEAEFERLKRETLAELIELRDNDQALVQRWFRRSMFGSHPYGRTTTGSPTSLGRISLADVREFRDRYIVRSNLIFALSGDISERDAELLCSRVTAGLPEGSTVPDSIPEPVAIAGRRMVFVDKPERTQTQILMGGLGTLPSDPDHIALTVANTAFGGTFTARLMQQIRAERGWSYGAYSQLPYDRRRQAFSMWCFPAATDAADCLKLELAMLEDFVTSGITQEELDYAKRYLVNSNVFNFDTAAKRVNQRMEEVVYGLPPGYHTDYAAKVECITLAAANAAVAQRISLEHLLTVVVGTESETGAAVRAAIPNLQSYETVAYDSD